MSKLIQDIDLNKNPLFNKALKRFLLNNWEVSEIRRDYLVLVTRKNDVVTKKMLLSPDRGVRISTSHDNWTWSNWSEINDVTINL